MQLLSVNTTNDWKYRPHQTIRILATSDDRAELLAEMDKDVLRWQQEDLDSDELNDEEEARGSLIPATTWQNKERWEMDQRSPENPNGVGVLRKFAFAFGDGGSGSICYHILG